MPFNFNADEIFEIAEKIELNGAAFYKEAAAGVSDEHYKKMLLELSIMEIEHQKIFSEMRNSLKDKDKESTVFDPSNESALYLKSLADLQIFYKKQIDLTSIETILLNAIDREKDSIVFYIGMKDLVPARLGKDKIDNIINEEKKHIQLLVKELTGIKK